MASRFGTLFITFGVFQALLSPQPMVGAANILAVQTIAGKSHWNMMRTMLQVLTDRGHTVTVFTPFADGDRDGYTVVDVSGDVESRVGLNVSRITRSTGPLIAYIVNALRVNCGTIFEHPRMQDILEGRSRPFDVVIAEAIWLDCVSYAATVLRVPVIYVVPSAIVTHVERSFFGHVSNPAAVSNLLSPRGVPKTFGERFTNTLRTISGSWLVWNNERRLRKSDPRPFDAMDLVRPSLTFTNTHFITEPSRPLTPDVVQIGGIHLTPPGPIPKDILEFIDDAPNGVIYFTFGSVVSMASLPENVLRVLKEAIAQVPQKVLWKYDIVCHGGISGVYEAVDAGVPLLGFPIFFDQPRNIDNLVDAGMAISMDLFSVTKDTVFNTILEIVNNDRYRQNAKIASDRFKDRPMSPAESVVYWTEYVMRHNGAPHLKSHALNLTWYQYFLVDIVSTFLFIGFVLFFIIYYGLKMICKHIYTFFHSVKAKRE